MTDFNYACYITDIAVSKKYQQKGVGKALQEIVKSQLELTCKLVLIAAPAPTNTMKN